PHRPVRELAALVLRLLPAARPQVGRRVDDPPLEPEQHAEHQLRDRDAVRVRGVAHDHATRLRRLLVDVVEPPARAPHAAARRRGPPRPASPPAATWGALRTSRPCTPRRAVSRSGAARPFASTTSCPAARMRATAAGSIPSQASTFTSCPTPAARPRSRPCP